MRSADDDNVWLSHESKPFFAICSHIRWLEYKKNNSLALCVNTFSCIDSRTVWQWRFSSVCRLWSCVKYYLNWVFTWHLFCRFHFHLDKKFLAIIFKLKWTSSIWWKIKVIQFVFATVFHSNRILLIGKREWVEFRSLRENFSLFHMGLYGMENVLAQCTWKPCYRKREHNE